MKKKWLVLGTFLFIVVGATISLSEKLKATEVSGELATKVSSENRTVRALVEQYKSGEDPYLLDYLQKLSPEAPIIEWNGGFFSSDVETKETFTVATWNKEGTEIISVEGDAATVGEVLEAINALEVVD